MTDKMREFVDEVKQLCKDFSDQRDRPYMGDVHAALDGLYEQWQAAQAVPVVGEVVAWDNFPGYLIDHQEGSIVTEENLQFWLSAFIKNTDYNKPATSITTAELERLRRNDARLNAITTILFDDWHPIAVAANAMPNPSNRDELFAQLDAAIAAEGEK